MPTMHGRISCPILCLTIALLVLMSCNFINARDGRGGQWELLLNSSGVVAMHMALTHHDTVLMFDQNTYGQSALTLQPGVKCSTTSSSCWAHSVEFDIATNTLRPLPLKSDTWCSSGAFLANGTLAHTGGYGDGYRRIRYFRPCSDGRCGWTESGSELADNRWYSTNQILPEDLVFVVGGRDVFTYEFVPKSSSSEGAYELPLLRQTYNEHDQKETGNNLYPIVHLSSDGKLFVFANRDSILLDYHTNKVVKTFPRIPGNGSRSYPETGSSVMLPLDYANSFRRVEIMICGGGATGAYREARNGRFLRGLSSCGRIVITDENPEWEMEEMPEARLMGDMLILPTGDVLIINGAKYGCAGWERATEPSYSPYLYKPYGKVGERFSVLHSSTIARMYHSSAILLPDGRILVAGSNPEKLYTFSDVPYPTELRVEAFVPYYMGEFYDDKRAFNVMIHHGRLLYGVGYGEEFEVRFDLARRPEAAEFHLYAPPFTTHSQSMSQRMLKLACSSLVREENGRMLAVLVAPPSPVAAPMGYYLLTVVNGGIPSKAGWMRLISG